MSSEDKSKLRRSAFIEYIKELDSNSGKLSDTALKRLNEAFDISEDDIISMAQDVAEDSSLDVRMARLMLLMEDMRDYRDILQINGDRSSILKESLQKDMTINEGYLFLG